MAVVLLACIAGIGQAKSQSLNLTVEEEAWIAANPVVRMGVIPDWKPIEYIENEQYKGLVSEYMKTIMRKTGLHLEPVLSSHREEALAQLEANKIDMLPGTLRSITALKESPNIQLTTTYHTGSTLVVTRDDMPVIFDLARLNGKKVALKHGGIYEKRIRALYPKVGILLVESTEEGLAAVASKKAAATVGADAALLPYMRRKYADLHVSGVIASLPMDLAIAVRYDQPLLRSILDKSLASLTAKETDDMDQRWLEDTDYGAPSWPVLIRYYSAYIAISAAAFLLIVGFAFHARREHRRVVQSEKEKSMFLAVMSHEIRSPMNAILASIELLQRMTLPRESKRLADIAVSGAENLLRLLDDVLDISKLEAGRLDLDPTPLDIMELTTSVTDLLGIKAREKGITLTLQARSPLPYRLMLDRLRVGQILHNLVSNALKFTPQGTVDVSVWLDPIPEEGVTTCLCLQITDTGIGMGTEAQQRLFQPYMQATTSTSRRFGGTGLGLIICHQLVELMGGKIDVKSELNKGTTITVQVPCKTWAGAVRARSDAIAESARVIKSRLNVLVIEDTLANQRVLQAQLKELGCVSTLAPDGATALHLLEQANYDVVLLDCDLPDISGYEVAHVWRERENQLGSPPTPILAISASTDAAHSSACFEAGMDAVIKKPLKLAKLRDALELWGETPLAPTQRQTATEVNQDGITQALRDDLAALHEACAKDDAELALHYLHRLVGSAEVLDAKSLAVLARKIETDLRAGQPLTPDTLANLSFHLDHLEATFYS